MVRKALLSITFPCSPTCHRVLLTSCFPVPRSSQLGGAGQAGQTEVIMRSLLILIFCVLVGGLPQEVEQEAAEVLGVAAVAAALLQQEEAREGEETATAVPATNITDTTTKATPLSKLILYHI